MADNTTLNTGSGGDTIATDDIGGVKFQRVKIVHGVDGTNDGDVASANPLPVDGSGVTQPVSGTVTANAGTGTFTVDGSGVTQPVSGTVTANAGTGTFAVGDGGSSLTVDSANDGSLNVQIGDGSNTATIRNLASNDALNVAIVDGSGGQITSFGGGTQYTEDAASSGGETGTVMLGYRQDADTSPVSGDGDFHGLIFDNAGNLKVNVKAGSSGGVTHTDDAAFTAGTDDVVPAAAFFNDLTPDSVDEGDAGALRMSANRNLYSTIRDAAGNERGVNVTAGNALVVDGSASTQPISGTVTANAGTGTFTVDGSGVTQPVSGTVTANAGTGTFTVDGSGVTQPVSAVSLPLPTGAATAANQLPDGHNVTVDNASGASAVNIQDGGNSITVDGTGLGVVGNAAHDAAVSGNPLLLAGEARTTTPTAVGDGDVVRLQADDQGRLITVLNAPRDLTAHNQITLTNTTETTLIAAGGAGVFRDIVSLAVSNGSSGILRVDIRDSTTGTVRWSKYIAADGGGFVINFPTPLTQGTANNNWTAQLSGTPASNDVRVNAVAVARV